jgi:hypothetical protein
MNPTLGAIYPLIRWSIYLPHIGRAETGSAPAGCPAVRDSADPQGRPTARGIGTSRLKTYHSLRPTLFFSFFGWGETKYTWYVGHCLAYCTSPEWWMIMFVKHSVDWQLAGEPEVLGENLPQCHLVHRKSHMTWPGIKPGSPRWEAGD